MHLPCRYLHVMFAYSSIESQCVEEIVARLANSVEMEAKLISQLASFEAANAQVDPPSNSDGSSTAAESKPSTMFEQSIAAMKLELDRVKQRIADDRELVPVLVR